MSSSNAAAIKRRANPGTASLSSQNNQIPKQINPTSSPPQNVNNPGLTLPQVISLVDKRLIQLESFMNQTKENQSNSNQSLVENDVFEKVLESMTNEINNRFEIFAEEIANLKDVVLKLQTYTMEVNKTLLSGRISTLGESRNSLFQEIPNETRNASMSVDLRELAKEEITGSMNDHIVFSDA